MKRRIRRSPPGAVGAAAPAGADAFGVASGRRPTAATHSAETANVPALNTSSGTAPKAWTHSPPSVADSSIPAWVPIS